MKKYEELENAASRYRHDREYRFAAPQVVDKVAAVVNNGVVWKATLMD